MGKLSKTFHRYTYYAKKTFMPNGRDRLPNRVGSTRVSWENAFISLWEPLIDKFSKGRALVIIDGPQVSSAGAHSDGYEGFARTFLGVAFYLHQKNDSTIKLSNGTRVDIAAHYREGVINGTNPRHREYWGRIKSTQRLVENSSVALGLLLTRKHIWDTLSAEEKNYVAAWFRDNVPEQFPMNNWQWFKLFHYLLLEETGHEIDIEDWQQSLNNIENMYQGGGWYSDGTPKDERHYDYYVPWAMHFYSLLFCYFGGENHREPKQKFLERSEQFLADYQYFLTPGNHPPLYGRSQLYRFASLAPWGVALLLNCHCDDLSWVKESAIDGVNTFLEKGVLRKDGTLSMGYYNEFLPMLETYSGPASPYWAFKGFSFLLLPEDHPFWSVDSGDVKPKELVHPIPATRMILLHSGSSQVTILNAGSSHESHPIKYNKFAYSNVFLPNYDRRNPVDNMLLLCSEKDIWNCLGRISESSCHDNVCELTWKARGVIDAEIKTTLIGRPDGYIAIHQLRKGAPILFQAGGFPIAQASKEIHRGITEDTVILQGKQGQVGIKLLHGKAKLYVYERADINPAGRFSFVPCVKGKLENTTDIIVFAVWGNEENEAMEIPSVVVDGGKCGIRWQEEEHEIVFNES